MTDQLDLDGLEAKAVALRDAAGADQIHYALEAFESAAMTATILAATPPAQPEPGAGELEASYLLMKRGLYYRPNAMGYTGIRDHAGRYSESEAMSHADEASGVTAIREDEAPLIAPKCFDDIARDYLLDLNTQAQAKIARLEGEVAELRADRAPGAWKDREDEWSAEVSAAHPTNGTDPERWTTFETAMKMVGNRHGKYALVGLVHWLLTRALSAEADAAKVREALKAFIDWGQQQCPCRDETPDPCPLCDATVAAGRCKAVEAKFPPRILADARQALAAQTERRA